MCTCSANGCIYGFLKKCFLHPWTLAFGVQARCLPVGARFWCTYINLYLGYYLTLRHNCFWTPFLQKKWRLQIFALQVLLQERVCNMYWSFSIYFRIHKIILHIAPQVGCINSCSFTCCFSSKFTFLGGVKYCPKCTYKILFFDPLVVGQVVVMLMLLGNANLVVAV